MFIACSNLIARNPAQPAGGLAVGDIDGDGRDEVIVAGSAGPNRVLKWDGAELADITDPLVADADRRAAGVACGDVDGDGREELYILNNDPPGQAGGGPKRAMDRLFACFGNRWIDLLSQAENFGAANRSAGHSVAMLDRFGHGRHGVLLAAHSGALRLLEMDRRGRLRDAADEAGLDAYVSARSLLTVPLLGGFPDVLVGCENGPNLLFRNQGDGTFEELDEDWGVADPRGAARGLAPIDGDGDGLPDLILANRDGPLRLFQQRPGGGFRDVAPPELALPLTAHSVVVADFDNDGFEEIFVTVQGEPNLLFGWRDERWQPLDPGDAAEPHSHGTGATVADLDGDGQLELLVGHGAGQPQPLALYIAEPRGHSWLRVRPLTRAGAPARGASVRLTAGGRTQVRAICGGSGYLCQMEPVAHFGLGAARKVERVEVRWPDGTAAIVENPAPCTTLVVPHPPG